MLDNDAITIIVIGAAFAVLVVAYNARWAIEAYVERNKPEMRFGDDEIVDRIEVAIRNATTDLLEALTEANASLDKIATSNQAILDDEDADAVRYTPAAPNIGSNLHRMIFDEMVTTRRERPPYAGAPDGLWLHDDVEPAEPVDLTKRPE